MTDLIVWIVVLGLAVVITGIYLLSRQIEKHLHDTIAIVRYSNEMILAQLERLTGSQVGVTDGTVGVILERRCIQRRNWATAIREIPGKTEQRGSPGRRLADFPQIGQADYSRS